MSDLHDIVAATTHRIKQRSVRTRTAYIDMIARQPIRSRATLSCGNLAHGFAASGEDKNWISGGSRPNIAIVTSYNDVLSAHAPYRFYPDIIKKAAREAGATAQVAAGVPAMCDGVTQGQPGMELSLFSRDTIALATAVGLSHAMFDAVLLLGICDKIVPGMLMGALRFGHLPTIFVPAGPMPTGLSHSQKVAIRQRYAEGKATDTDLLDAESATYHSEGTCTFYGTANSNQMMMEAMGLHVPAAAFVSPGSPLRQALTRAAVHRAAAISASGEDYRPLGHCVDEKAIVNAMVMLLATGGSTNHMIHLPAIARCAGITVDWDDFERLSAVVPLLARIYPNGPADVNAFQAAGGPGLLIATLLKGGLLHRDILSVWDAFRTYASEPALTNGRLEWHPVEESRAPAVVRAIDDPFQLNGGLRVLKGNLGRGIIKTSAVDEAHWTVEAEAIVFDDQDDALAALTSGDFEQDAVIVVRFQGPRANGMPELHKLTPILGALQDRGHQVALLTDGRMSGASGKVPAAIHVVPEASSGGPLARLRTGDVIRICARTGELSALVADEELSGRHDATARFSPPGYGRELFDSFRRQSDTAERGASSLLLGIDEGAHIETGAVMLTARSAFSFEVRPIRSEDDFTFGAFLRKLTPQDLRFRFLATMKIDDDLVRKMTTVDHDLTERFVAAEPDGTTIIASASIAIDPRRESGEVAISVLPAFKRRGISWCLLQHISRYAASRGLTRIESIESRDNRAAIELALEMGFKSRPMDGDPTLVVVERILG